MTCAASSAAPQTGNQPVAPLTQRDQKSRIFCRPAAFYLGALCLALPAQAGDVRVGLTLSDNVNLAPIFAAEKLGLFRSAGITVKRAPIRGINVGLEALAAGHVDIIDAPGPAAALDQDRKLAGKIVVTNASGFFGWTVVVNHKSGVQAMAELDGKKFAITTIRSLAGMAAFLAAERTRIKMDLQAVGAGALIPMLRDNRVSAVISPASLGLREVAGGGARIVYDLSLGNDPYTVSTLIASNAMISNRPSELRAFLAANSAALVHMQMNRKWSIDLLKEFANLTDTALVERMHDNIIRRMDPRGKTDPQALKNALALAATAWRLPNIAAVDPILLYTNEFIAPEK